MGLDGITRDCGDPLVFEFRFAFRDGASAR